MKRLISIPAYLWAIVCLFLIPVTFIGNGYFATKFATLPFMKINPIYTGGDSIRSYKQDSATVTIFKPVFESLIGTSKKGFVQVKFSGKLPDLLKSSIDYDMDSRADFRLEINTLNGDTKLLPYSKWVTKLEISSRVKNYWIVRVNVLNRKE